MCLGLLQCNFSGTHGGRFRINRPLKSTDQRKIRENTSCCMPKYTYLNPYKCHLSDQTTEDIIEMSRTDRFTRILHRFRRKNVIGESIHEKEYLCQNVYFEKFQNTTNNFRVVSLCIRTIQKQKGTNSINNRCCIITCGSLQHIPSNLSYFMDSCLQIYSQ